MSGVLQYKKASERLFILILNENIWQPVVVFIMSQLAGLYS